MGVRPGTGIRTRGVNHELHANEGGTVRLHVLVERPA